MVVIKTENKTLLRRVIFLLLFSFLVFLSIIASLNWAFWKGSVQLHTVMEVIATMLAFSIGILALIRFFSSKGNIFLTLGFGFLGTALLDGYHAIVTSSFFSSLFPSSPDSLIPWSWNASRFYLSVIMVISVAAIRREMKLGKEKGVVSPFAVFISTVVFTIVSFIFFAFYPLPRAYFPEYFFGRPEEFVSAVLFFIAMIGYLFIGKWKMSRLHFWVLMSLVVNFLIQLTFMPLSHSLFDAMFDLAHLLKVVSYIFVNIGLFVSIFELFKLVENKNYKLKLNNANLKDAEEYLASTLKNTEKTKNEFASLNELMVNREVKMVELKQENEKLKELVKR